MLIDLTHNPKTSCKIMWWSISIMKYTCWLVVLLCVPLFTGACECFFRFPFLLIIHCCALVIHMHVSCTAQALRDEDNIYIVTPFYGGGEVFDVVADRGQLEESEARPLFRQVLDGLLYLKKYGVCHR